MRAINNVIRGISNFLMAISAVFIALATVLATVNAIARFFAGGLPWAEELCSYFIVMMVYLAIPFLELRGDQLCISAIDGLVKGETGQRILNYIRGLLTGATMAVLSYYGFEVMLKAFKRSQTTYTLQIPKGYLYGVATVCMVLAMVVWLVILLLRKGEFDND